MHYCLGDLVLNGLGDDADVGLHEVSNSLYLSLELRVQGSYLLVL